MKENNIHIDEMLNSFLDGELQGRQLTEMERLVSNDVEIAAKLKKLQKCRSLLNVLPTEQAPHQILEEVKIALERRSLLGHEQETFSNKRGARHLLLRKALSAAALILLAIGFLSVIYEIVVPSEKGTPFMVLNEPEITAVPQTQPIIEQPIVAKSEPLRINGILAVRTSAPNAVKAYIARAAAGLAVKDDGGLYDDSTFVIAADQPQMKLLLADVAKIWDRFSSTQFTLDDGDAVTIENVRPNQLAEIFTQDSQDKLFALSKDLAMVNKISADILGSDLLAYTDPSRDKTLPAVEPVLTRTEPASKQAVENPNLYLTIKIEADK
ncbi:MAG: hypothetical protein PHF37_05205 [Phycisphaerae bacterium]|nr:hypothetical protein [Phycisphaerae bacterium]